MNKKIYASIITMLLLAYCIFSYNENISTYGHYLYLLQLITFSYLIFSNKNNYYYILSPSYLTLLYLGLNFTLGHYVVSRGIGPSISLVYYSHFINYKSIKFITGYLLLCNHVVFLAIPFSTWKKQIIETAQIKKTVYKQKHKLVFILLVLFVLANQATIDLSFLGGVGDFSYVFKFALLLPIVFLISL